jgi:hypothetical protein
MRTNQKFIEVEVLGAKNLQRIPMGDFEKVYRIWHGYLNGTTKRSTIRERSRYSKYVISILRWVEEERVCQISLPE